MTTYGPYRGVVDQVHDGDTVYVKIGQEFDFGFEIKVAAGYYARVRLLGQASNELSAADGSGKAARAYAELLLPVGSVVQVLSVGWDKYAPRIDGTIRFGANLDRDFTTEMIAAGYAVPWNGVGKAPVVPFPPVGAVA